MKKLLCLIIVACSCLAVRASNTVTLSSASGKPAEEVSLSVTLANDDAVTALELNIPLPDAITYVDGSCTLNNNRAANHTLTAAVVDGALKIYVYSLTQEVISGNDGELLTFKLKMGKKPKSYTLAPTVVLSDTNGKALDATVNGSTVTLKAPELNVESSAISYGRVPIRSSHTAQLILRNTGNEPLTVSDVYADSGLLAVDKTSFIVAEGASKSVTLTYSPMERGTFSSTIHIVSDAVNGGEQRAKVEAEPFSVNELHVSSEQGVSDSIVTVKLSMDNMEPIVALECSFDLPDQLVFVEGNAAVTSRGTNHTVNADCMNGKLKIYAYSPNNSAFTAESGDVVTFGLKLNGTNGTYSLNPTGVVLSNKNMENMTSAVSSGSVTIKSPTLVGNEKLNFGSVAIDTDIKTTYNISNTGGAPLVVERVTFLSDGYNVQTTLPMTIGAGESKSIDVTYAPQCEGAFSTTMHIYSNDPLLRMKQVEVSGVVYEPNGLSLKVDTLDDGNALLHLYLNNYSDVVALQFDVNGVVNAALSSDVTKTSRLLNHNAVLSKMDSLHYRILVYSASNESIEGHEGEILSINLLADKATTSTITLDSIVISDGSGVNKNSDYPKKLIVTYGVKYYTLNIGTSLHGRVEGAVGKYAAGTELTLRAVADEGYKFVTWSNGSTDNPLLLELMSDTTITATFGEESYLLKFLIDGEEYMHKEVPFGSIVSFVEAPVKEGFTFSGWSSEINDGDPMPAHDVMVTGSYTAVSGIDEVFIGKRAVKVYAIDGRLVLVASDKSDLQGLPRGVYIINGRKTLK